jgi:hypothetical protein
MYERTAKLASKLHLWKVQPVEVEIGVDVYLDGHVAKAIVHHYEERKQSQRHRPKWPR